VAGAVQTEEVREAAGRGLSISSSTRVKVINHRMKCKHAMASMWVKLGHNQTGQKQTINKEENSKQDSQSMRINQRSKKPKKSVHAILKAPTNADIKHKHRTPVDCISQPGKSRKT